MDNWNENNQNVSVSGQFNAPDQNVQASYGQPYVENTEASYGQPTGNSQPGYGQPYPNYNQGSYQGAAYTPVEKEDPVKMGEWMLLLGLTTFVPCVGWILALVWAFSKTEKKSKVNFCKAYMIIWLIQLALGMVFFIIYGAIFASVLAEI